MKLNCKIFRALVLLPALLAAGLTAQATVKTVTYTITDIDDVSYPSMVEVTFTRGGDTPFDAEAENTFTAYISKSALYANGTSGNFSVELADGFNLHAYWSAGSNVQYTNKSFYPFNTSSYISYNVSCNSDYYVTHLTMKSAEGNPVFTTSPSKEVDFEYENIYGFNQTYKSSSWFGKLIVTYSDVPTKLALSLNEFDGRYWGSFYSSAGYRLPEGAAAYTMDEYYHLYRVGTDGRTIPATTAVAILSDKKDITLNYTTESATLHGNNILKGSVSPVALTHGMLGDDLPYVVGVVNSSLGLYRFNGSELPAGKAFCVNGTEIYLNTLSSNYTAKDGQTLIGTLTSNVKISIADGATVTLQDVSISAGSGAGITCNGNATLILSGTNEVKSNAKGYPGIQPGGSGTTLTIQGTGSLNATGKAGGAGIGSSGKTGACGDIVIKSGTVIAKGGGDKGTGLTGSGRGVGPGIGCVGGNCGNITISGGDVTATGGYFIATGPQSTDVLNSAPGIGSCGVASCGDIYISGGSVTARGTYQCTAIGSGYGYSSLGTIQTSNCGAITITDKVIRVTATPDLMALDCIGRSSMTTSSCSKVTIGGVVYWDGTNYQNDGKNYLSSLKETLIYEPGH